MDMVLAACLFYGALILYLIYAWIREERRRYRDREKLREFLQGEKT